METFLLHSSLSETLVIEGNTRWVALGYAIRARLEQGAQTSQFWRAEGDAGHIRVPQIHFWVPHHFMAPHVQSHACALPKAILPQHQESSSFHLNGFFFPPDSFLLYFFYLFLFCILFNLESDLASLPPIYFPPATIQFRHETQN